MALVLHSSVYYSHPVNNIPYTGCSLIFRLLRTGDGQGNSAITFYIFELLLPLQTTDDTFGRLVILISLFVDMHIYVIAVITVYL